MIFLFWATYPFFIPLRGNRGAKFFDRLRLSQYDRAAPTLVPGATGSILSGVQSTGKARSTVTRNWLACDRP
ncbi:MAG: hypothetical protein MUE44_11515 [Oscillatoriaceae cyanobacterium Prado104]|nr:hypothetical protein [Oscillatoriaceae cyanobacterium Prado104]